MTCVVGVDGGGTKTTAAVVNAELRTLGEVTTGPANARSAGAETASQNVAAAITGALGAASVGLIDVAAICLCLAGFDTDLDVPVPMNAVRRLGYTGPVLLENDVVGAWAGATEASPGITVISGTGATALGMNSRGELWRTDGWDYILGDTGSGYAIGREGIRIAMMALDGRAAPTRLVRELADAYSVRSAADMRRLVDSAPFGKYEMARFAPHVTAAADAGDPTAREVLGRAGYDLAHNAIAIARQLGMMAESCAVVPIGGVFRSSDWVVPAFRQTLAAHLPLAIVSAPRHTPQVGAAILALRRPAEHDLGSWSLGTGHRRIHRSLTVAEASPAR